MIRRLMMFAAVAVAVLMAAPSWSAIEFFGTARVMPTYYSNFDFNDSSNDGLIINEGGLTKGGHMRAELRLGWKAKGEKWSVKMITEADVIMQKDTADRSFYVNADKEANPNTGGEFGIERVELLYKFAPQAELETGWDVRALDIKSGGLLYGDDHPFIGFRGELSNNTKYEILYIPIQNYVGVRGQLEDKYLDATSVNDWSVYSLKVNQQVGAFNLSPFVAYSDNDAQQAQIAYYGFEMTGKVGAVRPSFEIVMADGDIDNGKDISSLAMFAGVEMDVCKAFTPYVAFRYAQGDDDASDNDVEGWVGITDIARFTPLIGMDGGILSEDLGQSYGATLYSYSPERAKLAPGLAGDNYGGIGNGGKGNNPGQMLIALGAKGDLSSVVDKLSYKTQVFMIWYDETDNLVNRKDATKSVDDYAGTTFDLQLKYALDTNFSVNYIFGAFVPGDGIDDQYGDDVAMTNCLTLAWKY